MKYVSSILAMIFSALVTQYVLGQDKEEIPRFNETNNHQLGVGFAVTSFSSNFAYYVTPHYAYRHGRHQISFSPFYGRLDAVPEQQNIGVGFEYRIYPFKNLSKVSYYAPVSMHYTFEWFDSRRDHTLLYGLGAGSETDLGKNFGLSVDIRFALGQTIESNGNELDNAVLGSDLGLNYYFLPTIRLSYNL